MSAATLGPRGRCSRNALLQFCSSVQMRWRVGPSRCLCASCPTLESSVWLYPVLPLLVSLFRRCCLSRAASVR